MYPIEVKRVVVVFIERNIGNGRGEAEMSLSRTIRATPPGGRDP